MEGKSYMDLKPLNNKGESPSPLESNKKAIIAASVIVGVLLLVGVSYGVYYKKKNVVKQNTTPTVNSNVNQESPRTDTNKSNVSDTSDWQLYQNDGYGYALKYPTTYEILVNDNDSTPKEMAQSLSFRDKKYAGGFEWPGFNIAINPVLQDNSAVVSRKFEKKDQKNNIIRIFFKEKGRTVYASCALYLDETTLDVCNNMISTFTFAGSMAKVDTSDWQTYKNAAYGYELKYPTDWRTAICGTNCQSFGPQNKGKDTIVSINILDNPIEKAKLFLPVLGINNGITKEEDITVIGMKALKLTITQEPSGEKFIETLIEKNGKTYDIGVGSDDAVLMSTYNLILSTFKFTDSSDFLVNELGIKFKVAKELKDDLIYTYRQDTDKVTGKTYKIMLFSTKTLKSKDKYCSADAAPLGGFSRYEGQKVNYNNPYLENRDSEIKQFDTFFVHYSGSQSLCSTDVEYETNQLRLFNKNLPSGIEEIK